MNVNSKNSRSFVSQPENSFNRSRFDLSHDVKTTFSMGEAVPILLIEALPQDTISIQSEIMCRFAPLYLPIMHRVDMSVNFFYISNSSMWRLNRGWERFISMQDEIEIPVFRLAGDFGSTAANSLLSYLGYPITTGAVGGETVLAFPVYAYLATWDEYYRNPQIQEAITAQQPLSQIGNINESDQSANHESLRAGGADDGENDWLVTYATGRPLRALWNRDYLTSALYTPQYGEDVLTPIVRDTTDFNSGPYQWKKGAESVVDPLGPGANGPLSLVGGSGTTSDDESDRVFLDIQATSSTIQQLRSAVKLLEFMERLNKVSVRYRDMIQGFFGKDPHAGVVDRPVWFGGYKGRVVISEVMSTAETTTVTLGSYAGQALAFDRSKTVSYTAPEHGWFLGIININPRTSYMQGRERHWARRLPLDYAWTHFNGIGDQEIYNSEVAWKASSDEMDNVWGYIPRYSEYRFKNDIISGQMRTTWQHFHLGRIFNDSWTVDDPDLNSEFVTCTPRVTDVFQVAEGEDEIFCHIYHDIEIWRVLPKYAIPQM